MLEGYIVWNLTIWQSSMAVAQMSRDLLPQENHISESNLWAQTESVWWQQGAGRSKVRLHLQPHLLLPAPYHALSPPKPEPIAPSRGREHVTIHKLFFTSHCSSPGRLGNGGEDHRPVCRKRAQGIFPKHHHLVHHVSSSETQGQIVGAR